MEYTISADYNLIESSLKSLWRQYDELEKEVNSFVPKTLPELRIEIGTKLMDSFQKRMPNQSEEEIAKAVERQLLANISPEDQFSNQFWERFSTLQVMVTIISHALCESLINTILATECYAAGKVEQFNRVEQDNLLKKWTSTLKKICPQYELSRNSPIFQTLEFMHKQRNALAHYKVSLEVGDKTILDGSGFQPFSYQEGTHWLRRFFSLPYDLAENAHGRIQENATPAILAYLRSPIPKSGEHQQ
jgi:hypothetical protein